MTSTHHVTANACISMGGTANLFTLTEKSGMGAMTGTIDGAAYGERTSDLHSDGSGRFEYTMYHVFLDKDGSRLRTHDHMVLHAPAEDRVSILEGEYTVVEATGRFAGYRGTFRSRGWVSAPEGEGAVGQHAVGVVRFTGEICRE
ncbi:hypothetical protein LT350_22845 [Mycolicibacterium smegmatis]|uniref:hypothetical protein n=1 Tax=Mycolicibacterium smegmatis TaxID=1772 RepID=UPI001E2870AC|nr:hypothetical protein [Mycolicibacterium smegmatis]UGU29400.1 hypothetical protein LT350_22845 [Mycolicibacterium smegmatis]ULN70361.1 hypothetical protein KZ782_33370 [Mycolicibacterium smegmatis]